MRPVYGAKDPMCGAMEQVYGAKDSMCGAMEQVYGAKDPMYGAMEQVYGAMEQVVAAMDPVCAAMDPVVGTMETLYAAMDPVVGGCIWQIGGGAASQACENWCTQTCRCSNGRWNRWRSCAGEEGGRFTTWICGTGGCDVPSERCTPRHLVRALLAEMTSCGCTARSMTHVKAFTLAVQSNKGRHAR